jgi:hypothetical protein
MSVAVKPKGKTGFVKVLAPGVKLVGYDRDGDGFLETVALVVEGRGSASIQLDRASFFLWRLRAEVSVHINSNTVLDTWFVTPADRLLQLLEVENFEKIESLEDAERYILELLKEAFRTASRKIQQQLKDLLKGD